MNGKNHREGGRCKPLALNTMENAGLMGVPYPATLRLRLALFPVDLRRRCSPSVPMKKALAQLQGKSQEGK